MAQYRYLKKFLYPGSVCAAVVKASTSSPDVCDNDGQLVRRSDLPIYGTEDCRPNESACKSTSFVEKQVSAVRKELWVWYDEYKGYRQRVVEVIDTGKAHAKEFLERLRAEELPVPRVGAVALGGLAGLVLGLRRRWPHRVLYTTIGAASMAALCYPKEGLELFEESRTVGGKYLTIAYNFIYGVKPEGLKLPAPEQLLARLGGAAEQSKPEQSKAEAHPSQPSGLGPQPSKQPPASVSAVVADPEAEAKARWLAELEAEDAAAAEARKRKDQEVITLKARSSELECFCVDKTHEGHTPPPDRCKRKPGAEDEEWQDDDDDEEEKYLVDGKCRGTLPNPNPNPNPDSQSDTPSLDDIAEDAADVMYWGFRFIRRKAKS